MTAVFGEADWNFLLWLARPTVFGLIAAVLFTAAYSSSGGRSGYSQRFSANISIVFGYSLPIVLVGYVAGYLTGVSRAPVVGTIVPAVLALIGGLHIYFFGVDAKYKAIVGYSVFIFSLFLLYGVQVGSYAREFGIEDRLINLSEQERRIRIYRTNRDLPPDPAPWILTGESK